MPSGASSSRLTCSKCYTLVTARFIAYLVICAYVPACVALFCQCEGRRAGGGGAGLHGAPSAACLQVPRGEWLRVVCVERECVIAVMPILIVCWRLFSCVTDSSALPAALHGLPLLHPRPGDQQRHHTATVSKECRKRSFWSRCAVAASGCGAAFDGARRPLRTHSEFITQCACSISMWNVS